MIVTKKYLLDNRTEKGAWTRSQILALGVNWPPEKGWQTDVIGARLTDEQAAEFEAKRPAKHKSIISLAQSIISKIGDVPDRELSMLMVAANRESTRRAGK